MGPVWPPWSHGGGDTTVLSNEAHTSGALRQMKLQNEKGGDTKACAVTCRSSMGPLRAPWSHGGGDTTVLSNEAHTSGALRQMKLQNEKGGMHLRM